MVITVGYFCSGGYTEIAGIPFFLKKIRPTTEVTWVRCFPEGLKSNVRVGRMNTVPIDAENGVTGVKLVEAMIKRLELYRDQGYAGKNKYDYLLLIDDADCRFNDVEDLEEAVKGTVRAWQKRVDEVFPEGESIPLIVLFASPEVEAWLVADWENSFEFEYKPAIASALKYHLHSQILKDCELLEDYGGVPVYDSGQASCSIKLSNQIIASFSTIKEFQTEQFQELFFKNESNRTYSKKKHGSAMLSRVNPDIVAEKCTKYFAPIYRQLRDLGH